jgi:hypothetical protein
MKQNTTPTKERTEEAIKQGIDVIKLFRVVIYNFGGAIDKLACFSYHIYPLFATATERGT